MAAVAVTPADVQQSSNSGVRTGIALEAIVAGESVYKNAAGQIGLADSTGGAGIETGVGIAINSAPGAGQKVSYAAKDPAFAVGGTVIAGVGYAVGAVAGSIVPLADLLSNEYISYLGVGVSATEISLNPDPTGEQVA